MAKEFIDEHALKRVRGDTLESSTLRSDLAARLLFLQGTLLEAVGVVKSPDESKGGIGLKGTIINCDENEYIKNKIATVEGEINQLKNNSEKSNFITKRDLNLENILKELDNCDSNRLEEISRKLGIPETEEDVVGSMMSL
ncbi:hypothetical protein DAMA08_026040 [Martiniozyma asiatica (nom. inval.)]|nr:hypothetical protein DAMA08_026040 [Martiniozyma asiatica]